MAIQNVSDRCGNKVSARLYSVKARGSPQAKERAARTDEKLLRGRYGKKVVVSKRTHQVARLSFAANCIELKELVTIVLSISTHSPKDNSSFSTETRNYSVRR
jgi:hypothetical protein